jgi:hypothetical protein
MDMGIGMYSVVGVQAVGSYSYRRCTRRSIVYCEYITA